MKLAVINLTPPVILGNILSDIYGNILTMKIQENKQKATKQTRVL